MLRATLSNFSTALIIARMQEHILKQKAPRGAGGTKAGVAALQAEFADLPGAEEGL